jgi:hypothetical protein
MYRDDLIPMIKIAEHYQVTRAAIHKALKRMQVDTTKATAAHISTTCTHCGKPTIQTRCHFRKSRHAFCCREHFYLWLNRPVTPLLTYRHSLTIARKIISEYFPIQPDHVVHHEDRNEGNNDITNLRVFNNQADHIRYHRGHNIDPIWSGTNPLIKLPASEPEYIS